MFESKRFLPAQSGATAVVFAIAMVPIMGAAGLAIDYGIARSVQGTLQAATDAAALAGAAVDTTEEAPRIAAAVATFSTNIAGNGWLDGMGQPSVSISGQKVTVTSQHKQSTSLTAILGFTDVSIGTRSVAMAKSGAPVCILALQENAAAGIEFVGSSDLIAPNCQVWSNSIQSGSISFTGAGTVTTAGICAVGGISNRGVYSVAPAPKSSCPAKDDPLASWNGPSVGACTEVDFTDLSNKAVVRLQPGVYCGGINVEAVDIILDPGVYIIKDGPLVMRGNGSITGQGVGIYLTGKSAYLDMRGNSKLDLKAAASGPMKDLVLAVDRDNTSPSLTTTFTGNATLSVHGSIYLPTQHLVFWGSADATASPPFTQIVAKTIAIGGNAFVSVRSEFADSDLEPIMTGSSSPVLIQ